MFKKLQMQNKELQAETKDDSKQMPIVASHAQMPQNPLLSAALSTEDGNKLIAEFMKHLPQHDMVNKKRRELGMIEKDYHLSWDWLMPVVEQIKKYYELYIEYEIIEGALCRLQLEDVWLAVVEFIRWYNKNQGASKR